jgi:hypothetical protein
MQNEADEVLWAIAYSKPEQGTPDSEGSACATFEQEKAGR